jgi:hypothetical protein
MDDAPVLMTYDSDLETPISSRSIGIHHPRFGKMLKEKMDALGIECQGSYGFQSHKSEPFQAGRAFVKRHFGIAEQ